MRSVSPGNLDTLSRKTHNTNAFFAQCFGNTKTRAAYLHTLILLSPHLPQVHSQRHHALSPDLPHKHHIYSCHTYHTQWHTEPHMLIHFGGACHEETNTKSENKTKKNKTKIPQSSEQRFFGGSSLLIAPIAIDMHGSVFWSLELLRFRATSTKKIQNFVCNTHGSWKSVLSLYFPKNKTLKTTMVNLQSWRWCDVQMAT